MKRAVGASRLPYSLTAESFCAVGNTLAAGAVAVAQAKQLTADRLTPAVHGEPNGRRLREQQEDANGRHRS
jgi:hypothetical protein